MHLQGILIALTDYSSFLEESASTKVNRIMQKYGGQVGLQTCQRGVDQYVIMLHVLWQTLREVSGKITQQLDYAIRFHKKLLEKRVQIRKLEEEQDRICRELESEVSRVHLGIALTPDVSGGVRKKALGQLASSASDGGEDASAGQKRKGASSHGPRKAQKSQVSVLSMPIRRKARMFTCWC